MTLFLLFLFCLVLSAFFSGSEMAYVSANRVRFREMADSGHKAAKQVLNILEKPQEFLTFILIGNNVVNIGAAAIVTYWFEDKLHINNEWLITLILSPVMIILCDIVPKNYSRIRAQNVLLSTAGFLDGLLKISNVPIQGILKFIARLLGPLGEAIDRSIFVSEKEFRLLIEESTQSGVIERHEKQLIDTIMDFERIPVEKVMIPVEQIEKVDITDRIGKVKEIARQTRAKMVLVTEELPSIVVGMIYVFDILFETNDQESFKKYLRSPVFLPKHTTIEKAFLGLQEKRQSYAAVTDELGEVIGVVPVEKLFSVQNV